MLENLVAAIFAVMDLKLLLIIFSGVLIGLFVGILPGLGGATTLALLLPFIWGVNPQIALGLLVAIGAVTYTGGSITSILMNIPGESTSMATLLDGYPMNKKGQGARAIGAALTASMSGGILAVPMACLMLLVIVPIVMTFKSPEVFFLIVIGIAFIAVLSRGSVIKGLIAGGLGILISLIGFHDITGVTRFTYGSLFLYDRIHLAVFIMGFFGLPEMIELVVQGQATISEVEKPKLAFKDTLQGMKDVFRHKFLWLTSTIIGYVVGVIPGIGAGTAVWVAYGQAKQMSKTPEKFGTGVVEGVIAPESANNASAAGALLTAMCFGIPGSAGTAVLLGGFMLVGVVPGPSMMTENMVLVFMLLVGLAIANIFAGLICLGSAPYLSRIAFIPVDFVFPIITVVILVASVATEGALPDLMVVVIAGLLGYALKSFGYPRAVLALGFVLGNLLEYYFFMSLRMHGSYFFLRPACFIMIVLLAGLFGYRPLMARLTEKGRKTREDEAQGG